jgi:hypothetical protein
MTEDQRPHPDAEKVQGWWKSLDEHDQQRVRELIETGSELPADIADGLRSAGIYPAGARFMSEPGGGFSFHVPTVVVDYLGTD